MGSCVRPELGIACCYPPRPRSAQEKWQRRFIQDALRGDLDSLATNRSSYHLRDLHMAWRQHVDAAIVARTKIAALWCFSLDQLANVYDCIKCCNETKWIGHKSVVCHVNVPRGTKRQRCRERRLGSKASSQTLATITRIPCLMIDIVDAFLVIF